MMQSEQSTTHEGHRPETTPAAATATFWLYFGERVLTAVTAPWDSSDDYVRAKALASHQAVPLCFPEAPFEFAAYLRCSRVVADTRFARICAEDLRVGDHVLVPGGRTEAFRYEAVRSVRPSEVAVRLESGRETSLPGVRFTFGPLGMGMGSALASDEVAVRLPRPVDSEAEPGEGESADQKPAPAEQPERMR